MNIKLRLKSHHHHYPQQQVVVTVRNCEEFDTKVKLGFNIKLTDMPDILQYYDILGNTNIWPTIFGI